MTAADTVRCAVARALTSLAIVVAAAGCKAPAKDRPAGGTAIAADAAPSLPLIGDPAPLPADGADGTLGVAGPAALIGHAPDGGWVALCQGEPARPRLIVGSGPGLGLDRIVATGPSDVVATTGERLVHVDARARTTRTMAWPLPAAIARDGQRVVLGAGADLVVLEPGQPPRRVATGQNVRAVALSTTRWAVVEHGVAAKPTPGCDRWWAFQGGATATIDLDPGAEAVERVGPALSITPAGEVALDGEVVIGTDCAALVVAALASPPRVMARCGSRELIAGPGGFRAWVSVLLGSALEVNAQVKIADDLRLGHRVVCLTGGCVDLVTGTDYSTWQHPLVWFDDRHVVRAQGSKLLLDRLPADAGNPVAHAEVALPRLVATTTIDTVTGRRVDGPAPQPPAFVDASGEWLLYGRHVVDLAAGALVATLPSDALAIDASGRVLVPAPGGGGPFRWQLPR